MVEHLLFVVTLVTALGCGLIGGVFFAFSTFVMQALDRLPPTHAIAAMQSINRVVLNPWFLSVFLGTALLGALTVAVSILRWSAPGAVLLSCGGLLYVLGTFLVTVRCNVPRNDALAAVVPGQADDAERWRRYMREWTVWNHVRTAAALAACACLILALCF